MDRQVADLQQQRQQQHQQQQQRQQQMQQQMQQQQKQPERVGLTQKQKIQAAEMAEQCLKVLVHQHQKQKQTHGENGQDVVLTLDMYHNVSINILSNASSSGNMLF